MIDEEKLKSARKIYPALDWMMNKPKVEDFERFARTVDFNFEKGDREMAKTMLGLLENALIVLQKTFNESAKSYYWAEMNKEG